jgi:hypothetical protein
MRQKRTNTRIQFKDNFIFLFFVVLFAQIIIPSSKVGFSSLTNWGDQSYFLRAMKELEASNGDNPPIAMGLGYAALIELFKRFFSSYEVALIVLSLLSFTLIYTYLIQRALLLRTFGLKVLSVFFIALSYWLLRIPQVRDIPWSHFIVAALFFGIIYLHDKSFIPKNLRLMILGFVVYLLWQTRNFETMSLFIGAILLTCLYLYTNFDTLKLRKNKIIAVLLNFTVGVVFSWLFIWILTGSFRMFTQFSNAPRPDLNVSRFISRIYSVFYNPTHNSIDSLNSISWMSQADNLTSTDMGKVWFQPLIRSQPMFLSLLLLALGLVVYLIFISVQRKDFTFHLPILSLSVALIITAGYFSSPIFNQSQLKYGALREFILPQLLILFGVIEYLKLAEGQTKRTQEKFGQNFLLYLVLSVSILATLVIPRPTNVAFTDFDISINQKDCIQAERNCFFTMKVLDKSGWKYLVSQPIEIRVIEAGVNSRFYKNNFSFEPNICKTECFIYAVPLSFGIAETPESDKYFLQKKDDWILLKRE